MLGLGSVNEKNGFMLRFRWIWYEWYKGTKYERT